MRNISENESIEAGDEILEINEKNAIEVYEKLTDSWTKDSDNTTFPARIVSHDFSKFYAHVLGISNVYTLKIKQSSEVNFENTRHGVLPKHLVKNTIEQEIKKKMVHCCGHLISSKNRLSKQK